MAQRGLGKRSGLRDEIRQAYARVGVADEVKVGLPRRQGLQFGDAGGVADRVLRQGTRPVADYMERRLR